MPELHFGFNMIGEITGAAEEALRLEALGFDYVAWGEHYMRGDPPLPSTAALPVLGVAAGATQRIRLLSGVLLLPLYHPTLLAKMAASLDVASGGRLTLGVGIGGEFPQEFQALEVPMQQRGSRANEVLKVMRRLWTEDRVSYQGRHFHLDNVTLNPRPLQQPHPPVWVAGRREPAMRRAVRLGDGWFPYLYSPRAYRASVERIQELAQAQGRDLSSFQWGLHLPVAIADSEEEAAQVAASQLGARYQANTEFLEIVRSFSLLGPPEACVRRLEAYVEAGARNIIFAWAGLPEDRARYTETLARHVVPAFRR